MGGAHILETNEQGLLDYVGTLMEVYIDDMLVKMIEYGRLISDLKVVFNSLRRHKMRLNPKKCAFTVEARKFLGFKLTHRGIEANPNKCRSIMEMKSSTFVKEVERLTGKIASLSRFMVVSARKALLSFCYSRKGAILNG